MPQKNQHLQQYQHNKDFLTKVCKDYDSNYFDWKITTLFYSILHYADALLADRMGHHPKEHSDRVERLERIIPDKEYRLYLRLMNACRNSRYEIKYLGKKGQPACLRYYQDCYIPLKTYFKKAI